MKHSAYLLLLALMTCCLTMESNAATIKRKGRFLHTEIQGFTDKTSFNVTLQIKKNSSFPVLKVNRLTIRTISEIKVFETVIDTINTADGPQEVRDYRDLEVVPDEFIKDNPSTRQDIIHEGPFPNTTFQVEGIQMTTDKNGCIPDATQMLLTKFDDLTINSVTICVKHPTYGQKTVTFTRLILRPAEKIIPDYKKHDPKATMDVLEAMDVNSLIPDNPSKATIKATISYHSPSPGDLVPITINVTNTGNGTIGNLVLCSFSREDWLDGKLFYFGNIPPQQTRSFTRILKSPGTFSTPMAYVAFNAWDTVWTHRGHVMNVAMPLTMPNNAKPAP